MDKKLENRIKLAASQYAFKRADKEGKLTTIKTNSKSFEDGFVYLLNLIEDIDIDMYNNLILKLNDKN